MRGTRCLDAAGVARLIEGRRDPTRRADPEVLDLHFHADACPTCFDRTLLLRRGFPGRLERPFCPELGLLPRAVQLSRSQATDPDLAVAPVLAHLTTCRMCREWLPRLGPSPGDAPAPDRSPRPVRPAPVVPEGRGHASPGWLAPAVLGACVGAAAATAVLSGQLGPTPTARPQVLLRASDATRSAAAEACGKVLDAWPPLSVAGAPGLDDDRARLTLLRDALEGRAPEAQVAPTLRPLVERVRRDRGAYVEQDLRGWLEALAREMRLGDR